MSVSTSALHVTAAWDYSMIVEIQLVWHWMVRILIPIIVGIGLIVNLLCIVVWSRHSCGVPKTARFYYLVIAVLDFGPLITYHFLFTFVGVIVAERFDLHVLSDLYCSLNNWIWYSTDMAANLTYLFFCIERVYVVSSPLKAMGLFTLRKAMIIASSGILYSFGINVICLLTYKLVSLPNGGYDCETDLSILSLFIQNHYTFFELATTSCNALCNVVLVIQIVRKSQAHGKLTATDSGLSSKELATSLTVIAIVGIHVILFIPDAICWVSFFAMKTNDTVDSNPPFAYSFLYVGLITTSATAIAHCMNFFVYFTRIPAFRKALGFSC